MLDQATHVLERLRQLPEAQAIITAVGQQDRACRNPFQLPDGRLVRCGSRIKEICPSCARLAHGDWSSIMRSGVFDADPSQYTFVFLTCTAPSFGAVHRVPMSGTPAWCPCGRFHTAADDNLAGTPVDYDSYDFYSAVRFNRDVGLLWDRTRRDLDRLLPGVEYVKVYEPQARLVIHLHAVLRIQVDVPIDLAQIEGLVRNATAIDKIDGLVQQWGTMTKALTVTAQTFGRVDAADPHASSTAARTIGYMSKMINYMGKSISQRASSVGQRHAREMNLSAQAMTCSNCRPADVYGRRLRCRSKLHGNFGMRSVVVTTSRRGKVKTGWSFTSMTRRIKRAERKAHMEKMTVDPLTAQRSAEQRMINAQAAATFVAQTIAHQKHFNDALASSGDSARQLEDGTIKNFRSRVRSAST